MIPVSIAILTTLSWIRRWGGAGLIAVALVDNSVIPIPGGLDLMTALLAAHNRNLWLYYALMSTAGSVLGGYLTYRFARKGGKETIDKHIRADKLENVERLFERWGFGTVVVAAILPPPFPTVPFLAGAGALNYPLKKFLAALAAARSVRFTVLAYLASRYGRRFAALLGKIHLNLQVTLIVIGIVVAGAVTGYLVWRFRRRRTRA